MDFFSLPHQKHPTTTEDEDGPTELFAKAIDDRYSNPALVASSSAPSNNNRITPFSLSIASIPRNTHLPSPHPHSPHISSRSHSHHLPAPSPFAALFTAVNPADLPEFLSDTHTLILDIRPLPTYLTSRIPHAVPLSVPSTLLKRPLFSTLKLAEMLPNTAARRRFSQWRVAQRILVYDADSTILFEGSNILGLLRKFRAEAGLPDDPQPSGGQPASSGELQLSWLKGGFQAVCREQQSLLDCNTATDDDDDEDAPSPPSFADPGSSEKSDPMSMASRQMILSMPNANRPTLLRTKHLPMSAFTLSSTTSQRSGPAYHKAYAGQQAGPREFIFANPSGPAAEFVSRPSTSGASTAPQGTSDPGPPVAFNPFFDTIRQNLELSHGVTERISLKISRVAKDRIDDLPFTWLRELGRWASADGEGPDDEDNFEGGSGSGSGSGISGDDHSEMSSDSEDDSGSGQEYAIGHFVRMNNPAVAPTVSPANHAATTPEDAQAEGSEALAMQFYRIELGEQRRLMGIMEHHSRESGRIMGEGQSKSHKSKSKRSKPRSKGTGRTSRGKHGSRDFPYSITAGVEKGAKNRYRNIWPFEHARVRLQKKYQRQRPSGKSPTPSDSNPGSLHPLTLPRPIDFLPPVTLSLSSARSIQLPLHTPLASSTDDYVNASFVQPIGTRKRYIATQGPLPETFNDFWLLVWEQNVHVIVMLTREVEGSTVKCGNYWSGEKFGPLRLKLLEVSGAVGEYEKSDHRAPGDSSFFPSMSKGPAAPTQTGSGYHDDGFPPSTVKRVLELSHTGFSHLPPRRILQFQYLDWPDLNVPGDTYSILELIREVEREVELSEESRGSWEGPRRPDDWRGRAMIGTVRTARPRCSTLRNSREVSPSGSGNRSSGSGASSPNLDAIDSDSGITKRALGERPVLLHCSAGVGRTGGFIAIDAVLDGVRREMRKRRESLRHPGTTWDDSQSSRSRAERTGHTSGSSTSEKDRSSSGDEVAAMDVDEASAGGRAPPIRRLVMKLPAEDNKAVVHVPVVGTIPPSRRPQGLDGALSYGASMDVDETNMAAISPWATGVARDKLQAWIPRTHQSEPLSSPSSSSAHESRPLAPSGEAIKPSVPQALSRSLSPSGDSSRSDISASSLPLSVNSSGSFSPSGHDANCISPQHRTFSSLAATLGANLPHRSSSAPTTALTNISPSPASSSSAAVTAPSQRHPTVTGIARPVTKRAPGSSVPPDTETGSDSSRGRSTGASSRLSSGTKSGSPETLPTAPSLMDLSSAVKTDLESLRLPLPGMSVRKPGSKSSESPPVNEDSPPNCSDPYFSQSQSQSDQHSPPAFDYTLPRRLHDDRRSPLLLSTLDEPIHRVIEDMREQRMSLCQSLRQYVFVHRAVIEGVLMLVDDERALYGTTWKDNDVEGLSKSVAESFPVFPTKQNTTSESGSIENSTDAVMSVGTAATSSITSGSGGSKSSMEVLSMKAKRRASPTELPKQDKRGDTRMSKRPSIKRSLRSSSDESSPEGLASASRCVDDVALTPLAMR